MKLGIVVSFNILIQNFQGALLLGQVTDESFCLQKKLYCIPLESKFYGD